MKTAIIVVVSGAAGVALGLYIAKLYARATVSDDIDAGLNKVGLGGGWIAETAKRLIVPSVA